LNGPGAKAGITWTDVDYPSGDEHEKKSDTLVRLRIPRRIWADDVRDLAEAGE
jgi:hypothetical protein